MPVEMLDLSLHTLGALFPGTDQAIARAIAEATEDCNNRPFLNKARKIEIQLELTPKMDGQGMLESVSVSLKMRGQHPSFTVEPKDLLRRRGRAGVQLSFHEFSSDNPHQNPLPLDGDGDSNNTNGDGGETT